MASNDHKESNSGNDNKKNQGGGCSSGAKKKKNGDHNRKRKVRPELQNTSSSSDGAISSELTQLPILRRTGSGDNHDKEKLLLVLMDKDKNLYSVPRELKHLVETAVREQQKQQENSKLTALRIASFRHYTTREEEEEERRRGVSTKLELYSDPWKIKKRLTPTDLGSQSRMLIQTYQVETHLKPYMLRGGLFDQVLSTEGLRVPVWDVDTDTVHEVVFKQWQTNKSYVFIGSWNQEFLDRRRLKENDEVGFLWDPYGSRFFFKVLSRAPPPNP